MKKSTFSYKEVAEICNALTNQDKTPSIHSVRLALGGGSPNKILGYLRQWQKEYELSTAVDEDLSPAFKQAILAECARKLTTVKERLQSQIDERENQLNELQELLSTAEEQTEELTATLEKTKKEADTKYLDYEKKLSAANEQVNVRTEYANELVHKTDKQLAELREQLRQMQEEKHKADIKAATAEARNAELEKRPSK
jgi:DNA repair exonuclease SbcCD ATPase subunit